MRDVLSELDRWTARGDAVALATVVSVKRSAPRPPGAKMAVSGGGEISGMVSGGCVEGAVVTVAEEVLAGAPPRLLHFGIADEEAWDVGLPCGGEIDVWVQRHEDDGLAALARTNGRGALVTRLDDGARLLVSADGATQGTLGDHVLDAAGVAAADELMWLERSERRMLGAAAGGLGASGALAAAETDARGASGTPRAAPVEVFVDAVFPPPRLIVFGAVDFAADLCTLARQTGWRAYVADPRARFATAARFPDAEQVIAAWPREAFAQLGGIDRGTSIAVLTHDPKLDDAALEIALRSDASYVGAMGSRRAQESRRERLLALGFTDAELERLAAPIGLDLGALSPQETALSIMAEVVACRRGRDGGRLTDARGRIHEVGA